MTLTVFLSILLAAFLHALWNALVKGSGNKFSTMAAVVLGHVPIAVALLPFVPLPAPESLPYLLAGALLHMGYQLFLLFSYRVGDLTQVYPVARGSAPLIVATVSILFLGITLGTVQLIAILIIAAGILSLCLVRQADGTQNSKAALLALVTGCFIAAYSLVDGIGARLAGTALGFFCWLAIFNGFGFALLACAHRSCSLKSILKDNFRVFALGGSASFCAYALVVWSFTQAPIALVTALRETSIVFALLIGVFVLREKLNLTKVLSTMITLFGAALLRFSRNP
ncbi:DMT family transporter [Kiloniella sp. b19]|uniref:DMT family transporter n=1 Tax=Kiloniella sp. GXU_MW_B19 TaxID=3141326 RepID=UPI0031D1FFB8